MKTDAVVRMARALKWLVCVMFVGNLLILPLLPGYTIMAYLGMGEGVPSIGSLLGTLRTLLVSGEPVLYSLFITPFQMTARYWGTLGMEVWTSAGFFLGCGLCTAVILRQAWRILDTIIGQTPFQKSNAAALGRAAVSCWCISALALLRMAWWFLLLKTPAPLLTFTALFCPLFLMAGLLFLVMSALFRQAAELKEDQDLII